MIRKNLTLLFEHFGSELIGKDVFLVPYYLGRQYGYSVTIVYSLSITNKNVPPSINGVKMVSLKSMSILRFFTDFKELKFFLYLIKNAGKIDFLMRFHNGPISSLMIILYKIFNHKGFAYLKLDINPENIGRNELADISFIKRLFYSFIYKYLVKYVDVVSCETLSAYEKIMKSQSFLYAFKDKLVLVPNGFDEVYLNQVNMREYSYEEKENLIITVGRLGTFQKNTEMFLSALKNVDLKSWKVYLIGPIEESFQKVIESFFEEYPEKKGNIVFTGSVFDKKELWGYYNRAKVFVLTSRWEGYPIVFPEAKRFKNYIVSTDVGAFNDISENGKYGTVISQNSERELSDVLNHIITGKINIDVYTDMDMARRLSWENMVKKIKR